MRPADAQANPLPSYGADRTGTAGFQFLKVPVDPRTAALGESTVAHAEDIGALQHNPALVARGGTQAGLSAASYYVDTRLLWMGAAHQVGPFTLGLSAQAFDAGELQERTVTSGPAGTGRTFGYGSMSIGLTAAQALTDIFSYGVTVKYARTSSVDVAWGAPLVDLGVAYSVGQTGARLGVAIRNFGLDGRPGGSVEREGFENGTPTTVTEDDFARITPPTTFLLGVSYDLFQRSPEHALTLSGQLTNPNDNAERFNVAAEYTWNRLLTLRSGYQFGLEEASLPSFGFGLAAPGVGGFGLDQLRVDYAFTTLDRLGSVHRIGLVVRAR